MLVCRVRPLASGAWFGILSWPYRSDSISCVCSRTCSYSWMTSSLGSMSIKLPLILLLSFRGEVFLNFTFGTFSNFSVLLIKLMIWIYSGITTSTSGGPLSQSSCSVKPDTPETPRCAGSCWSQDCSIYMVSKESDTTNYRFYFI